ncbi:hypothetical protein ACO0K9_19725 [Undibacterium sp. Ji50W]|uniref:hypothetical protein n=1 Tax=Undibacterium sp. Ji50W TaxID=3413041 RepID=UPI003BF2EA37
MKISIEFLQEVAFWLISTGLTREGVLTKHGVKTAMGKLTHNTVLQTRLSLKNPE